MSDLRVTLFLAWGVFKPLWGVNGESFFEKVPTKNNVFTVFCGRYGEYGEFFKNS